MESGYRKIELQEPEDLTYLIGNVRRAAAEGISAAFPPVEDGDEGEDELRVRIEQLVDDYIRQTFTLAAPNLTINGMPVSPVAFLGPAPSTGKQKNGRKKKSKQQKQEEQEEGAEAEEHYEPFDGRKRLRVEELAREEEDLLREIAALKRRVPAAAAASFGDRMRGGIAADEQALEEARKRRLAAVTSAAAAVAAVTDEGGNRGQEEEGGEEGGEKTEAEAHGKRRGVLAPLAPPPLERQEAVEESFAAAVAALSRLKREMPATVAKMERARVAGEYVITGR